jgi:hypothetical protein
MRTVPRGRVWWEAGSLAPITVSSTTRFLPYLYYAHYFPLLSSSTPTIALVIGPPLGLPARPGKRPDRCDSQASLPTFQNTKRPSVRRLVKAFSPCCRCSSLLARNRSAASAVEIDPSKIHPIADLGENFLNHATCVGAPTTFVDRFYTPSHDHLIFCRTCTSRIHRSRPH